jgi:hypothetical protein
MQIHELTQPGRPRLDEAGILNKLGGMAKNVAGSVGDATGINRAIDTGVGIIKNPSSLISSRGLGQAQQYTNNKQAARAAAKLSSQGVTGERPTLGQSLEKFRQNPAAQQWVNNTVAKWPAQAQLLKTSTSPTTPVTEAPFTTRAVSAIKRKQPTVTPADPTGTANATYRDQFRKWVNQQLKTVSLDTLEQDPNVKTLIEPLIDMVVDNQNNLPQQQKAIAQLLSVAVAANHATQSQSGLGTGYGTRSIADNTGSALPLDAASDLKLQQELRRAGVRRLRSTRNPAVDGMFQKLGITIIP